MNEMRIDSTINRSHLHRCEDKDSQEQASVAAGATSVPLERVGNTPSIDTSLLPNAVEAAAPAKPGVVSRALAWFASFVSPESDEVDGPQQAIPQGVQCDYIRPELDKPSSFASDTMKSYIAKNIDDGKPLSKVELEKLILAANRNQIANYEEDIRSEMDETLQKIRENDTLKDKYLELTNEAQEKQKASTIFNWTSVSVGVVGGALALGGIVAAVVTAGAAIPAVLGVGAAIAAISGGATQIASGVFKYQGDHHQGEAIRTREERTLNKESIQIHLQDVQTKENTVTELWSNARRIVSNQPHFFDGSDG